MLGSLLPIMRLVPLPFPTTPSANCITTIRITHFHPSLYHRFPHYYLMHMNILIDQSVQALFCSTSNLSLFCRVGAVLLLERLMFSI